VTVPLCCYVQMHHMQYSRLHAAATEAWATAAAAPQGQYMCYRQEAAVTTTRRRPKQHTCTIFMLNTNHIIL
jgi:hypothetical protein